MIELRALHVRAGNQERAQARRDKLQGESLHVDKRSLRWSIWATILAGVAAAEGA
jgi:hypothetical protein